MSKDARGVYRANWAHAMVGAIKTSWCVVERANKDSPKSARHWVSVISLQPLLAFDNLGKRDMEAIADRLALAMDELDKTYKPVGKEHGIDN